MDRDEIQQWLCGPAAQVPSPATVAGLLGLPVAQLADTTMLRTAARVESLRFTLALLRDRFENDFDVHIWLDEPRYVLGGHSASWRWTNGARCYWRRRQSRLLALSGSVGSVLRFGASTRQPPKREPLADKRL
jgi:hypothetical protein